jgi:hypothetical protein
MLLFVSQIYYAYQSENQQDYYKEATIPLYIIQPNFHFLSPHLLLDHAAVRHFQDLISKIYERSDSDSSEHEEYVLL